jgi:L-amino acid N-acyltransferase
VVIRDLNDSDLAGLLAIYNDVIATSTAVFMEQPVTIEDRRSWWQARVASGYPVLVAEEEGAILGFSTFGDFRTWPGYRYTVEHSVHVRADRRGKGIGSQLIRALFPRAAALGKHMMIAGVDAANTGSIRLHERLGFKQAGLLREVGFKFGRRLDLVFLQREIS